MQPLQLKQILFDFDLEFLTTYLSKEVVRLFNLTLSKMWSTF